MNGEPRTLLRSRDEQVRDWLIANHQLGDYFVDADITPWLDDLDDLGQVEIPSFKSAWGRTHVLIEGPEPYLEK